MRIWHSSSSCGEKCIVCGKKTSTYKVYEESGITLSIPLCDKSCYDQINIKNMATLAIRSMKAEIKRQGGKNK